METEVPGAYVMLHTADVFLVDDAGMLRAIVPFGTDETDMAAVLREVEENPAS